MEMQYNHTEILWTLMEAIEISLFMYVFLSEYIYFHSALSSNLSFTNLT